MELSIEQYDKIVELSQSGKSNKEICDELQITLNFLLIAKRKIRDNGVNLPFNASQGRPKENKEIPNEHQTKVIIDLSLKGYHVRQIAHELLEKETRVYKWKQYIAEKQNIIFPRSTIKPYFCTIAEYNRMNSEDNTV